MIKSIRCDYHVQMLYQNKLNKLDTGRYTPEFLTEWEQVKHVSTLVITENKTTLQSQ